MTKATHNGTCQACGRNQAVKADGRLAKHGYTGDYGYFNGTCSGAEHAPLEKETAHNVDVVAAVRTWADQQEQLSNGNIETVPVSVKDTSSTDRYARKTIQINRADFIATQRSDWQKDEQQKWDDFASKKFDEKIESVRFQLRNAAKHARKDADILEALREKTFGNELTSREVTADQRPQKETGFKNMREAYTRADELKKLGFVSVRVNGGTARSGYSVNVTYRQA